MEYDKLGLRLPFLLEAVSICLDQLRDEFTSDIIIACLNNLINLDYGQFPPALMRTSILVASKYEECKRFVLREVVPALIQKQVWAVAPQIWEGVIFCIKKFAGAKDAEMTLKASLTLPPTQLKALYESTDAKKVVDAPTMETRKSLKKILLQMTENDREAVLSTGQLSDELVVEKKAAFATLLNY